MYEGQALPPADLTARTPESTGKVGSSAGKPMTWKASLCGVQKRYLQKGSHILLLVLCQVMLFPCALPGVPSPVTWGELLAASGLGTANPSHKLSSNILYLKPALYFFFSLLHSLVI